MKNNIIDFILTGVFAPLYDPRGHSRMTLLQKFSNMKGLNKKNGAYAALYKDNVFYHVGHGSIGRLEGVRIVNITDYEIDYHFILKLLQENNIPFQYRSPYILSIHKFNMHLYFADIETREILILSEIIQAYDPDVIKKLSLLKV